LGKFFLGDKEDGDDLTDEDDEGAGAVRLAGGHRISVSGPSRLVGITASI